EVADRFLVRRLVLLGRVPEDRDLGLRVGALAARLARRLAAGDERLRGVEQERTVLRRDVGDADRGDLLKRPAAALAAEARPQQRCTHVGEELLGERLVPLAGVAAEVRIELEAVALV